MRKKNNRPAKKTAKFLMFGLMAASLLLSGCKNSGEDADETDNYVVVGFSQVGAESDWRAANTESMKAALCEETGYKLIIEDAQQKQSNQITAVRSFIQQGVDYIVIAPVTEVGWETVLAEAKEAGIPVIIVDRMVSVNDYSLFKCWVGSDFKLEALKVCEWLNCFAKANHIDSRDIHVVNIQGTLGASAQIGRTEGLRESAAKNGWDLLGEVQGEFTKAKGYEVTFEILEKYPSVNVIYCENDNEAFGVLEALQSLGKTVGSDITNGEIMVLSFDGVKSDAMNLLMEGKIACIGECNPLHGPRVRSIIDSLESNQPVDKLTYVDEEVFSTFEGIESIELNGEKYGISSMNEEKLLERQTLFSIGAYTNETSDAY